MTHGSHIYAKGYDMVKATMCEYPQSDHALQHWRYVLQCCTKFPCVNLPDQEIYYQYYDTSFSIRLHVTI